MLVICFLCASLSLSLSPPHRSLSLARSLARTRTRALSPPLSRVRALSVYMGIHNAQANILDTHDLCTLPPHTPLSSNTRTQ